MNEQQMHLINAYHDGELDVLQQERVRQLIDTDDEAFAFWQSLRRSDEALKTAYDALLDAPLPLALQRAARKPSKPWFQRFAIPLSLAAGLAVVAVIVTRHALHEDELNLRLAEMQLEIAKLRQSTLENVPSGTAVSWVEPAGHARVAVKPLKTFRTDDDRFCREYEERIEDADSIEIRRGIACRVGKEQWPDQTTYQEPTTTRAVGTKGSSVNL
ncbi:hypothetical protein [Thiosocius teredinicola]|uniref:hypothetical protein n=1 Tax=Thiosocius teredinicola TaxID=1973002 RepID=UPI000990B866